MLHGRVFVMLYIFFCQDGVNLAAIAKVNEVHVGLTLYRRLNVMFYYTLCAKLYFFGLNTINLSKSNKYAMTRNWSNQNPNSALKTKRKCLILQIVKI